MRNPDYIAQIEEQVRRDITSGSTGFPLGPGFAVTADDKIHVLALDINPGQVYGVMAKYALEGAKLLCWALDRFAKEDQGTTESDLLTVYHWSEENPLWRLGIIEYSPAARAVLPFNEHNPFWSKALATELLTAVKANAGLWRTFNGTLAGHPSGPLCTARLFAQADGNMSAFRCFELQQALMESGDDVLGSLIAGIGTACMTKQLDLFTEACDPIFEKLTAPLDAALEKEGIDPTEFFGAKEARP